MTRSLCGAGALSLPWELTLRWRSRLRCSATHFLKDDARKERSRAHRPLEHKAERKDICSLVQRFAAAEETVVKFLNRTNPGVASGAGDHGRKNQSRTDLEIPHRGLH